MIAAHTQKNPCEVKKKKEPPRDLQFPQSPVNLNISTKRSGSQGQRRRLYLHKSWRGVITRKKKTRMPISVTQPQCVSIFFFLCFSQKAIHQIFSPRFTFFFFFFLVFHDSSVLTSRYPVKVDLRAFVHSCFCLSHHLSVFVLHQSECSPRRRGASRGHQSVGDCQSEPKNFNIYCGKNETHCVRW